MFTAEQALQRAISIPTYPHGWCMKFVSEAYANPDTGGQYLNAYDNWNKSPDKHPGDKAPPAGAPIHFSPNHICLATGKGQQLWTTDRTYGINGLWTIDELSAAWGYPYLGWVGTICGYPITFTTPETEDEMTYCMIRESEGPTKTVAAFYDATHWQELAYDSTDTTSVRTQNIYAALAGSLRKPFDNAVWNNRSNQATGLKQPIYLVGPSGFLTPLTPTGGTGLSKAEAQAIADASTTTILTHIPTKFGAIQ